jgi:predicted ATPase/class 3 adenylate cyclase/Tfp pilus assembly protein PilF
MVAQTCSDPQNASQVLRSPPNPMPTKPRADTQLPTGTVTFLFTDIEGSTTLWEQIPDAMRPALAYHDGLVRDAIESNGGCIVKSTGDGVHAVFAVAADALTAGVFLQRALQDAPAKARNSEPSSTGAESGIALKVRMGIHTGAAEQRDGDYFGTSVNRAARIMSVAHGDQLLLSAATEERVRGRLPEGVTLRELGEHRLKGLLNPERLLQVVAPGLRTEFPPLASFSGHSLPAERDAFVGRRESLSKLRSHFDAGARLVSVLGIGGTGKTRLVARFGWDSLGQFPGGAWFCDLSQARSLDGIVHAVALGLDLPLGKDDPATQIGNAIAGRGQCLVILDNFEQVARHAEETLGRWLNRANNARFLVTTREVLGLPGEEVLALAPMSSAEGMALFVRRAAAAKPDFQPSAQDQAAIAPLVKLLEGLPLAIELAAARVRVMSPRTLLARMTERFKLLSSAGGRVDRQATLRAVFDWSWDLLSLPEKAALAQLSVFEGGFTLDAVEAILDLSGYEKAPWPVDALQSLVHKSFVRELTNDRFDLLVSVQEYAAEHLRTERRYPGSGPEASRAMEVRHGAYFAGLDDNVAMAGDGVELDNFIVACRRAAARGDAPVAVNALERAWMGIRLRGPFRVASELVSLVHATPGLGIAELARVAWIAGRVMMACGKDDEAGAKFESSLAQARAIGDRRCECRALIGLGSLDSHAGHMEASRAHLEAALVIAREMKDRPLQSDACNGLGNIDYILGRLGEARAHFEASLALARKAGDRHREGDLLGNLGSLSFDEGRTEESRSYSEAALAVAREMGNRRLEGNTLCNLGLLHQLQGRFSDALDQLDAALEVARDLGHARLECVVLCNLGMVYDSLARIDEARSHFEAALVVARDLGDRRSEGQFLIYLGLLHAHQGNFEEARHCLDASEALLTALSDRLSLGILSCSRAEMEHLVGSPDAARAALAEAGAIAAAVGAGPESELGLALARIRELLGPSAGRASTAPRPDDITARGVTNVPR